MKKETKFYLIQLCKYTVGLCLVVSALRKQGAHDAITELIDSGHTLLDKDGNEVLF